MHSAAGPVHWLRSVCAGALLACVLAPAQADQAVPPVARVTDLTSTLSAAQKSALEAQLEQLEQAKGSQIAVLVVPSTEPESIEQYALRVAESWKLGRKDVDDGALLLIAKDDRALRIEVGYGLEGALPDAIAKRIIEEHITPRLREGDFHGGVAAGLAQMIRVIQGEPLPPPRPSGQFDDGEDPGGGLPLLILLGWFGASTLRTMLGKLPAAMVMAGAGGVGGWLLTHFLPAALGIAALMFFFGLGAGGGRRGRGWSSRGGFGGMGGGFGRGGGFGGGGGSFGGGGASGRW